MRPIHQGQRVLAAGVPLAKARGAVIMVHGRGASAEDILTLAELLPQAGLAFLAPQAAGHTWYPNSFLAPIESNEPWLSSALTALAGLCQEVETNGPGLRHSALLGFSQGACLTLEFFARNPRRYGAVIGFTGGLIGPDGTPRDYPGSLAETPVFLGCGDPDPHIPVARVHETAEVLKRMGAEVTVRIYPGLPHTVNQDEADAAGRLLSAMLRAGQ
ncbi:MAG TPA: alpha/beta hydrolase [Candidatus Dormibacteraeota bacterium]